MVNKNWDDEEDEDECGCGDDTCDTTSNDVTSNGIYEFTVDDLGDDKTDKIFYKCPDFPNCSVVTPFAIRLSSPADMAHYMKYHDV
jgi:hypothetical protein